MMVQRYAYIAGWVALGALVVLLVVGFVRNPTQAARTEFERQLADATTDTIDINFAVDPKFGTWREIVTSRANLWGPLVPPEKVQAPPPALEQMLAGVEPTRNTMGSGATMRVQIRIDGKKDWYSKGQQAKGCTIEEITDSDVLFTVVHEGKKFGFKLNRK